MATLNTLYNQDAAQMGTGGNLAPIPSPMSLPAMGTGGNMQATAVPTMSTGGNLPPLPSPVPAQQPVTTVTPWQFSPVGATQGATQQLGQGVATDAAQVAGQLASQFNYTPTANAGQLVQGLNQQFARGPQIDPTQVALGSLEQIMNSDNPYMRSAIRRGLETAGSRGLLNSNMASGLAQRAAVESSMPIFQEAMGLNRQRESQDFQETMASREQAFNLTAQREQEEYAKAQQAFQAAAQMTGQDRQNAFAAAQGQLDRAHQMTMQRESIAAQGQLQELRGQQEINNMTLAAQIRKGERVEEAQLQNWLSSENFAREFNANLSLIPLQGAMDLNRAITHAAVTNPELYTPQIVSGMNEFFHNNMLSIMQQYFPGSGG